MAGLRWILLLAGLVFLLALAAWELQRGRRARRAGSAAAELEAQAASAEADDAPEPHSSAPAEERAAHAPRSEPPAVSEPEPREPVSASRIEPTIAPMAPAPPMAPMPPMSTMAPTPSAPIEASPPLRVVWRQDGERHIIAVRIVAAPGERLSGRAVRQAFGACGLVHGPYRIYHQPGVDGRALLSCANLTQPGDFDPLTLDFQRLTGLSLFTVVPGPLPPLAALEHLLDTARDLAQRLNAELGDERGAPLDEARLADLRAATQRWDGLGAPGTPGTPAAPGAEGARGA